MAAEVIADLESQVHSIGYCTGRRE